MSVGDLGQSISSFLNAYSPDDYLWLLPSVSIGRQDDILILQHYERAIEISGFGVRGLEFLNELNGMHKLADLLKNPISQILIPIIKSQNWLVRLSLSIQAITRDRPWLTRQLSYYAHTTRDYPDKILAALSSKSVLVLGSGGVGSHIAFGLCASGIGNLIITDRDVIEESNLNRQFLYTLENVGRPKAHVITEELLKRFPGTQINGMYVDFCEDKALPLPDADLIILCGEISILHDEPERVGIQPILPAGYWGSQGVVGPFISVLDIGTCWSCYMRSRRRQEIAQLALLHQSRPTAWNSSGTSINAMVGAAALEVAIRILVPSYGPQQCYRELLLIDPHNLTLTREPVEIIPCIHSPSASSFPVRA